MHDENSEEAADRSSDTSRLRLVDRPADQLKAPQISEAAANELCELIAEVQRGEPRKKKIEDDLLPPAA